MQLFARPPKIGAGAPISGVLHALDQTLSPRIIIVFVENLFRDRASHQTRHRNISFRRHHPNLLQQIHGQTQSDILLFHVNQCST